MDKRDFETFYRDNMDRIYRYVFFRVGGNRAVAEDLVSDVFMKALEHFETYDPSISKSAWIYRIAHNRLVNHFRDQKPGVNIDDIAPYLASASGPGTVGHTETDIMLEATLLKLEEEERRLVTLKYLDGYTYADMADILGRSADALKVATHRAMQRLKELMKEPYDVRTETSP